MNKELAVLVGKLNAWMGHSSKVAEKSYLQVTPDHWKAGASDLTGSEIGGPISANLGLSGEITGAEKLRQSHEKSRNRYDLMRPLAPPVGLEPTTNGLTVRRSTN